MKRFIALLIRVTQTAIILLLALVVYLGIRTLGGESPVHALPEYTARTGESCAACHVNPGGGGPRTLRGLLWSARGRPDAVPEVPGLLVAAEVTSGSELYDVVCAGCHGNRGEGLYAMSLARTGISRAAARTFIRRGIPNLGMPAYEGQLTEEQLDALASFVAALGRGEIPPDEYPLPPPELLCSPAPAAFCAGE